MLAGFLLECAAWWRTVPPAFAFLLALPFAVAAVGLLGELLGNGRARRR